MPPHETHPYCPISTAGGPRSAEAALAAALKTNHDVLQSGHAATASMAPNGAHRFGDVVAEARRARPRYSQGRSAAQVDPYVHGVAASFV
jgi:hypothetical protein